MDVTLLDGGMGQELVMRSSLPTHVAWGDWVMRQEPHLVQELHEYWIRQLFVLGFLEVAAREDDFIACRLTPVGARVIGAEIRELETGLQPLLPQFRTLELAQAFVIGDEA